MSCYEIDLQGLGSYARSQIRMAASLMSAR